MISITWLVGFYQMKINDSLYNLSCFSFKKNQAFDHYSKDSDHRIRKPFIQCNYTFWDD